MTLGHKVTRYRITDEADDLQYYSLRCQCGIEVDGADVEDYEDVIPLSQLEEELEEAHPAPLRDASNEDVAYD
jgi:hypothetical protein